MNAKSTVSYSTLTQRHSRQVEQVDPDLFLTSTRFLQNQQVQALLVDTSAKYTQADFDTFRFLPGSWKATGVQAPPAGQ